MEALATTQRLAIRTLRPSDAERLFCYRVDPEVSRFQSWTPQTLDEVRSFIAGQSTAEPFAPDAWRQLGIFLREDDVLIGDFGAQILSSDPAQVEIGIALDPAYQRLGYATEAFAALLGVLFEALKKHRVFCGVDPRNVRSIALLERLRFRKEAHMRESLWFKGEWVDDVIYAMLRREWLHREPAVLQ